MKTFFILVGWLAIITVHAQDAQTFRKAFDLPETALTMQGSETSIVPKNKKVTIVRKPEKLPDPQVLNEETVYYTSKTEAIEISKADLDKHLATVANDKITLEAGCEYTTHYINHAMRRIAGKATDVKEVKAREGFIKFADDTVWVNPNLSGDFEDEGVYFYKLTNRQTLTFSFTEYTVSPLTLPIKYRFKGKKTYEGPSEEKTFSEDFSTAINLNVFGAHAWGWTHYHYRDKTGSITTTEKLAAGVIIGASTVTLDASNTSAARIPITGDTKITKGLVTLGAGGTYSINKLSFGLFGGWDFSIGDDAARWNYNNRPWVGLAIGYALFPFAQ